MNALRDAVFGAPWALRPLVEHTGWVLIHSLWLFAVIAASALMGDRLLRRHSASCRYFALLAALTLVLVAPVAVWCVLPVDGDQRAFARRPLTRNLAAAIASPADALLPQAMPGVSKLDDNGSVATAATTSWSDWMTRLLEPWLATIVVLWCGGVLMFSIRPVWSWCNVRRLRSRGISNAGAAVQQALERVSARLQLVRRVKVLASSLVTAPVVVGCFRSVILLPVGFISGLPMAQLEAILAHELAHVRRYDYLVNLLQTLVETLFFYHPAVWWLSHRIREERENCCDDLVVAALGNKVDYGRALLAVEEFRSAATTSLALSAKGGSLLARIRRLFAEPARDDQRSSFAALMVLLAVALVTAVWVATPARAGKESIADQRVSGPPFVAQMTDELSVELLAILAASNGKQEVWRPDGRPFENPPSLPAFHDGADRFPPEVRHLFFRWKGKGDAVARTYQLAGLRMYLNPDESGLARVIAEPTAGRDPVSVRVGITDADWGPWQKVNVQGTIDEPVAIPTACRDVYQQIRPDHTEARVGSCLFCWTGLKGVDDRAQWEVVAFTADGARHEHYGRTAWNSPTGVQSAEVFQVPLEKVDRFEYRLRPFRHWATFRNVALKAGRETEIEISVEQIPVPKPNGNASQPPDDRAVAPAGHAASAKAAARTERSAGLAVPPKVALPDGTSIELAGVRSTADRSAWFPDGSAIELPEDWPDVLRVRDDRATHGLIFRCDGFGAEQGLVWDVPEQDVGVTTPVFRGAPGVFSISGNFGARQQLALRVGITDSWGPWQAVNIDGSLRQKPTFTPRQQATYGRLQAFRTLSNMVVLQGIAGSADVDYEIVAVDKQGERHPRRGVGIWRAGNAPAPFFDLGNIDLDHWEFRLREVRHWVTFGGISLASKLATAPTVTVQSQPDAR